MQNITVRVYGLLINERNEILVSDEIAMNRKLTKFPGGGLEFGEGPIETLKREFLEEFNQEIEVKEHFYTCDFFQYAFSSTELQMISIYYFVQTKGDFNIKISEKPFDKENFTIGDQTVRLIKLSEIRSEIFTLPSDKIVAEKLKNILKFEE